MIKRFVQVSYPVRLLISCFLVWPAVLPAAAAEARKPNILFIAVDDLNDWIGCLGGHPQAKTPHLDRLAASGTLFANAYCPGASCNPSRSAILSGIPPHRSGLYNNMQKMRQVLPDAELIPKYFTRHGYESIGSGKILHYFIDAPSWDQYFPAKETEDPFPRTFYPKQRPVNLPYEPWMYVECDWAALDLTLDEYGGDYLVAEYVSGQLRRAHDKPFFLACGIYRPHLPWFVPKEYYDLFPLEEVHLPPGVKENDLDDLPDEARRLAADRYLPHIRKYGKWREGVQAYLASIAFADDMVGRVLAALDKSPNRDSTIVVLWGDHGWHLGEKEHWRKFTGWRVCDRVPLMIRVPKTAPGLPGGTSPGSVCSRPVNLVDLFNTLNDLCGLPPKADLGGNSLVSLLADPQAAWPHPSVTFFGGPERYAVSTEQWRYIHYRDGGEELYDIVADPYEWTNLAGKAEYRAPLARMRSLAPAERQPLAATEPDFNEAQPERELAWHALRQTAPDSDCPQSRNSSTRSLVLFENLSETAVRIYWIDPRGRRRPQGESLPPGGERRILTFDGHSFLIADSNNKPLGYVVADDRPARVPIRGDLQSTSSAQSTGGTSPASSSRLDYETRMLAGWTVHVSNELLEKQATDTSRALELLESQLDEIAREVPKAALAELKNVPLWISPEYPGVKPRAEYHPNAGWLRENGRDPAMAKAVEFTNVRIFEAETRRMPNFALHELAHAYHDRVLDKGFGNPQVKAAFEKAKADGTYDRVERWHGNGKPNTFETAYAMESPMEYFAETSEALFSRNDFFPFTRDELEKHDPEMLSLLKELWRCHEEATLPPAQSR